MQIHLHQSLLNHSLKLAQVCPLEIYESAGTATLMLSKTTFSMISYLFLKAGWYFFSALITKKSIIKEGQILIKHKVQPFYFPQNFLKTRI